MNTPETRMRRHSVVYFGLAAAAWLMSFLVTPHAIHSLSGRVLLALGLLVYFMLWAYIVQLRPFYQDEPEDAVE